MYKTPFQLIGQVNAPRTSGSSASAINSPIGTAAFTACGTRLLTSCLHVQRDFHGHSGRTTHLTRSK
jgi:hypothetical protein